MNKQEAVDLVRDALKTMVTAGAGEVTEDMPLIGRDNWTLDSVGLTTLVIQLEELIFQRYNKSVNIVSDKVFSVRNSPFSTVGTLAEFLVELME